MLMSTMSRFRGMTTSERLFAAKLLEAFDASIRRHDRSEAMRILQDVELSRTQAEAIVGAIEQNPAKYGYAAQSPAAPKATEIPD
jgi:phospholipase/lecithinase/hemolysin